MSSEAAANANVPRETATKATVSQTEHIPYRLRLKRCTACGEEKARAEFPKKPDRSYADRCFDCRASGARAKPRKRRRAML